MNGITNVKCPNYEGLVTFAPEDITTPFSLFKDSDLFRHWSFVLRHWKG
jgi:hypothetical protein